MVIPRYYYGKDFVSFESYLLENADKIEYFKKGEYLNGADISYDTVYYILEGLGHFYILHESGGRSIISLHGYGTIYPLYRQLDDDGMFFKLEESIFFQALTDMKVVSFSYEKVGELIPLNDQFCRKTLRAYLLYINLLLYRTSANEYDDALQKISNYLFSMHFYNNQPTHDQSIMVSQNDIADFLGISRVHVSRTLKQLVDKKIITVARKHINITELEGLLNLCSNDIIP